MTIRLLPTDIDNYAADFTTPAMQPLPALTRETHIKTGMGQMLSGHVQGALLQMLSKMIKPKYILELGTFTGYSAICLAQGLAEGGSLHTIEADEELYDIAAKYFTEAGLREKIVQHTGKAAEVIPTIGVQFDLVFIDADKVNYVQYYEQVLPMVPPGGFILADNVLYEGEVVQPVEEQSKNAKAMHRFNRHVQQDVRVEHVLLPVRDGIMIVRKR